MINEQKIKSLVQKNVAELKSTNDRRLAKYRRNLRRYLNSNTINVDDIKSSSVVGYQAIDQDIEYDSTTTPDVNIIKSCIDTLVSKIAQSKVRPYFNCINGSFKDIQIVKQAQQFFDQYYDIMDVNKIVSNAFRDACIFDTGAIFIDEDTERVYRALPWQIYCLPAEHTYGKYTRLYYEQKDFPISSLPEYIRDDIEKKNKKLCNYDYVKYCRYFDTFNHLKVTYISELQYWYIESDWKNDVLPFVLIHYNTPITGNSSISIVDMLYSIQGEIDILMAKIKEASQLNPAQTFFVPKGSDVKAGQLNNRIGNIVTYTATPNMTGVPVLSSTPDFISGQYMQLLNELKETAYEMVGISQLSAQSQKPVGLDSGVALQTMENIESDRFETQLNQIVRAYVEIAKICIGTFDKSKSVLPKEYNRVDIKWGDIVKESDKMQIQYSGADSLSKDPATKLQQLQMLSQAGVIPAARVAQFMEIPDLQGGYSLSNNAVNAVMTVIDDCLTNDNFDVDDFIPYSLLKEEIINTQLSLRAADYKKNKNDIDKLNKLYNIVEEREQGWTDTLNAGQAQVEEGIYGNVLEQEAGMQQVAGAAANQPIEGAQTSTEMDTQAGGNVAGNWNR